nr:hypothetical protein [Ruminococcus bromii]
MYPQRNDFLLVISDSAMLPLSATGGGRKATPTVDCTNNHKTTLGHDLFLAL